MVYTLTLTKCALPHPGRVVLMGYFSSFFLVGVLAYYVLPALVDPAIIGSIKQGREKDFIDFTFALASMAVPYFSTSYVESRERRRIRRATVVTGPLPPEAAGARRASSEFLQDLR